LAKSKSAISFLVTQPEQNFINHAATQGHSLETLQTNNGDRGIIRAYKLKLSELFPNTWNPNKPKGRTKEAIGESLDEFGQILECVVRVHPTEQGFQIGDGEHRFKELLLSKKDIQVSVNVIFGYSDAEFKKLTIILNETRGSANDEDLSKLLWEISDDLGDSLIVGLPYDHTELEALLELTNVELDALFEEEKTPEPEQNDEWRSLNARLPKDAMDVLYQARTLIEQEKGLHEDKAIAWGQVLECLAAEYLAR